MIVDPAGKPAATRWRVVEDSGDGMLVEFTPETGRTHQIRAHAAHALSPIAGDPVYGRGGEPMRLHSARLVVPYTEGAPPIDVTAPVPQGWSARSV